MTTTAATLHQEGLTHISPASEAANALAPIAGHFAFAICTLGIIGTGLLAVPVLAGSAGCALAEAFHWQRGLSYTGGGPGLLPNRCSGDPGRRHLEPSADQPYRSALLERRCKRYHRRPHHGSDDVCLGKNSHHGGVCNPRPTPGDRLAGNRSHGRRGCDYRIFLDFLTSPHLEQVWRTGMSCCPGAISLKP